MSKSILQDKRGGECYLCKLLLGIDTPAAIREEHHVVYGTADRKLSERYGLKVYLCPYHHRTGQEAVHRCAASDTVLKQTAQREFERRYGPEKWREVFGRNYLPVEEPETPRREAAGTQGPPNLAAGREPNRDDLSRFPRGPAATWKNQQNEPFSQFNISHQNTPSGFRFLTERDPGKEGL